MTENMRSFLRTLSYDKALAEKARQMDQAQLTALALELGIVLCEADFVPPPAEMSEDELDSLAGGVFTCRCNGGGQGYEKKDEPFTCSFVANGIDVNFDDYFPTDTCQLAGSTDVPSF